MEITLFIAAFSAINLGMGMAVGTYVRNKERNRIAVYSHLSQAPAEARGSPAASEDQGTQREPADRPADAGASESQDSDSPAAETIDVSALPAIEDVAIMEQIPVSWLDRLSEIGPCSSLVEASVQVLRLEVGKYRKELAELDERVRRCGNNPDEKTIREILAKTKQVNQEWLNRQREAAGFLQDRQGNLGDYSEMGLWLDEVLMIQQSQIESTCTNIETLDVTSDISAACNLLTQELNLLLDLAHSLRDGMHETMLTIFSQEQRLGQLEPQVMSDPLTGAASRVGLESIFQKWRAEDPNGIRLLSLAMLDIDRLGELNARYGVTVGDRLLRGIVDVASKEIRQDSGWNRLARFAGHRLLLFSGDTGPRNATAVAERIRQAVDAAVFQYRSDDIQVTISCAVTEIRTGERNDLIWQRLGRAIAFVKDQGRNATAVDEGAGPQLVTPPEFKVRSRMVNLTSE